MTKEQVLALAGEPVAEVAPSTDGSGIISVNWLLKLNGSLRRPLMYGDKLYTADQVIAARKDLEHEVERLEARVAELESQSGEVAGVVDYRAFGHCSVEWANGIPEPGTKLFTFPPIHDISEIENRVAKACAAYCEEEEARAGGQELSAHWYAKHIRSGEWRKYK